MESIHHRMQGMQEIWDEKSFEMCLNTSRDELTIVNGLIRSYDLDEMEAYPVRVLVKNPRNNRPVYIQAELFRK